MPSELDRELKAVMDRLTAPGGPLETMPFQQNGYSVPMVKQAPPSLPPCSLTSAPSMARPSSWLTARSA